MKNLANLLAGLGILLAVYSVLGRFIGGTSIGCGLVATQAKSGVILANSLMLISILIRQFGKYK